MISASARLRGLRAVMTREIDESFAALRVDIDRQFDELAAKYAPTAIHGVKVDWPPRSTLGHWDRYWAGNQNELASDRLDRVAAGGMVGQAQIDNQFRNALDAQAGLFNYGTRPYYPIN